MRRRELIAVIGGAVGWPLCSYGQQHPPMGVPEEGTQHPVIGFLYAVLGAEYGFRRGLSELGFFEGTNVAIDYRWSTGQLDHLPAMASVLAKRNVAVIICFDNDLATQAAKVATKSIPIVFTTGGDPVRLGFVASLKPYLRKGMSTGRRELLGRRSRRNRWPPRGYPRRALLHLGQRAKPPPWLALERFHPPLDAFGAVCIPSLFSSRETDRGTPTTFSITLPSGKSRTKRLPLDMSEFR